MSDSEVRGGSTLARLSSILALVLPFFPLAWMGLHRFVARDEGYYVLASKLVKQGRALYTDFFYTQMPLLPEAYGAWMKLFGFSWVSARLCSAFLAALLGYLLYRHLEHLTGILLAWIGLILYTGSFFVLAWYPTVQTYALSTLLLFCAYFIIAHPLRLSFTVRMTLAGVFLGLSASTRLFFIGTAPAFVLYLLLEEKDPRTFLKAVFLFSLGTIIGLFPAIFFALRDFDSFWFDNFGYHIARSEKTFVEGLRQKWRITRVLFGFVDSRKFFGFGFAILLYSTLLYVIACVRKKARMDLALLIAGCLLILNMIPVPAYVQYHSTLVPFLVVCTLLFARLEYEKWGRSKSPSIRVVFYLISAALLVVYFQGIPQNIAKYTENAIGVPGIGLGKEPDDWRLETMSSVAEILNKISGPGDLVVAHWPGYLLAANASIHPGLENHFGFLIANKIAPEMRKRFRVMTKTEALELVRLKKVSVAILSDRLVRKDYRSALEEGGYEQAGRVSEIVIFRRVPS